MTQPQRSPSDDRAGRSLTAKRKALTLYGLEQAGHKVKNFPGLQTTRTRPPPLNFMSSCPWKLPTTNNRISNFDPAMIARDAMETVVVLHPRLPDLISDFLTYKREYGSDIEMQLYKHMSQHDLVARLIKERPLHFVQQHDYTVLRNGHGLVARDEWLRVGTDDEGLNRHIRLAEYLSYDEQMLSSLLGTSGPTFLITRGDRSNCALTDGEGGPHQERGVIVGLVGARLHQPGHMDAALILPLVKVNQAVPRRQDRGVTRLFRRFFGVKADKSEFNVELYKARMRIPIDAAA